MSPFSIIIPVYNEEGSVKQTIDGLKNFLLNNNLAGEIIAINDGSTDKTKEILETLNGIKIINHQYNKGYGAAIKTGVKEAKHEIICIIDADGTYPMEEIKTLISYLPEYDMAVGARSGEKVKMPLRRRFVKFFLILLIKILTGVKVPDMNSGLRVFKKSLIKKYMRLIPDGFSLTTTITICSIINNHKIKYVNINYHPRTGASKIHPIKDTYNFFIVILKTVLYFKPLKVLLPVGIFLMIAAVAAGIWSVFFLGRFLDTTTLLLFVSGLQIFILALLADLIVNRIKNNNDQDNYF